MKTCISSIVLALGQYWHFWQPKSQKEASLNTPLSNKGFGIPKIKHVKKDKKIMVSWEQVRLMLEEYILMELGLDMKNIFWLDLHYRGILKCYRLKLDYFVEYHNLVKGWLSLV